MDFSDDFITAYLEEEVRIFGYSDYHVSSYFVDCYIGGGPL